MKDYKILTLTGQFFFFLEFLLVTFQVMWAKMTYDVMMTLPGRIFIKLDQITENLQYKWPHINKYPSYPRSILE